MNPTNHSTRAPMQRRLTAVLLELQARNHFNSDMRSIGIAARSTDIAIRILLMGVDEMLAHEESVP